jgi:predicted transcriptional regulator
MTVTQKDLDGFYGFATGRLPSTGEELSFDDLVIEWESLRDREAINAAVREGLADVEAGRHRPAGEVMEELRKKHGLPTE